MSQRPSGAPLRAFRHLLAGTLLHGRRVSLLTSAVLPLLLGASTLLFARGDAAPVRGSEMPAADTMVVYGPRTFSIPSGSPQTFIETFTATVEQAHEYTVRLVNGDSTNGTLKATGGYVRLNGFEIISSAELAAGQTLVKPVLLFPSDTLEVRITGVAGSRVALTVRGISDPTFPVLAERMFERQRGQPFPDTVMFNIPAAAGTPFTLFVRNGEIDGTRRNSSSLAWVNGTQVIQQLELNQTVSWLVRSISLSSTQANRLIVQMDGTPGSRLYFRITAADVTPPVITINEPIPNQRTRDATVQVSGHVRDETALNITVNGAPATVSAGAPGTVNYTATAALPNEGNNTVLVRAVNAAGLMTDSTRIVIKDTQAPQITVTAPPDNLITNGDSVTVTGSVTDAGTTTANLNGIPLTLDANGNFSLRVALASGANFLTVTATDQLGNSASDVRVVTADRLAPTLTVTQPNDSTVTNAASVTVRGSVIDSTAVTLTVAGSSVTLAQNGSFAHDVTLAEGLNTIVAVARDAATNETSVSRRVYRDITPPVLTLTAPANGLITNADSVDVTGVATDAFGVAVRVNGQLVTVAPNGGFGTRVGLLPGANLITVVATDGATNSTTETRTVIQDKLPPTITITAPANGTTTNQSSIGVTGTIVDSSAVTATINDTALSLGSGGAFSATVNLAVGSNTITIQATDAATNAATATRTVTRENPVEPGVPPDPSTVAPALDRTIATNPATSTQFLYNGATPIQTGVAANAIDVARQAVIRGRVLNGALQPLQGVTVSVNGAPQLGSTKSRVDGWYDLAVNGGGVVALDYAKTGYLPAQRNVDTPWQDFTFVDDVVLLQPDPASTTITLGNPNIQVVRGSAVSDADGARRTTLLVEPNTQATIIRADGTTQPATSLTLRVTEYTVGDAGPAAMPAELPPTSGYTFAFQVTADEATAIGAREVTFSAPVPVYLENFLNFPVGMAVPVGAFDVQVRAWVPEANGRIIKILSVSGSTATIDADGDGAADSDAALSALGIDVAERQQLATLYAANQTLWRAVINNTRPPWDFNYPVGIRGVDPAGSLAGGCTTRRSDLIGCEIQVVMEDVPIQGAPFSLAYNSSTASGSATSRSLDVTLTGATLPPELQRIELHVEVGGRRFKQTFPPTANLTHTFTWDGKDAYGRPMQGAQPVTVRIGHVYPKEYRVPAPVARSFGIPCTSATCVMTLPVSFTRGLGARVQTLRTSLGAYEPKALGIGGVTPNIHHLYDPVGRVLYKGDGTRRSAAVMPPIAHNYAGGGGTPSNAGDGTPALTVPLNNPYGLVVSGDGSLYIATSFGPPSVIRRVRPDGIIERVAGSDTYGNCGNQFTGDLGCGDDGPATAAGLKGTFTQIAIGPDGSIYYPDNGARRVRRIGTDGIIRNFAGLPGNLNGEAQAANPLGDGGPATQAGFVSPWSVAVAPDGTVFIADQYYRIRRVGPDGIITTLAGTGLRGFSGDGGPAALAQLDAVKGIALGPDGSVYILTGNRIRRVTPDGIITTIAGAATGSVTAQGVPATTTRLHTPTSLAVARDGAVYFTDHTILRRVETDGIITTVAGRSVQSSPADPRAALDVDLGQMEVVTVAPDGALYVGVSSPTRRIYRITAAQGGFSGAELPIADDQDDVIHIFTPTGRHLRTIDATTRVTLYSFTYDAQNRLVGLVDQFNQTTQIVRDGNGIPLRIIAATGQIVNITLDANGYLASLTGPDGRPVQFVFTASGLLTRIVNENGQPTNYAYDAQGRLTSSTDANSALQTATATGTFANRTVTFQSVGERATLQSVQTPIGGTQVTVRDAQNRAVVVTENPDGSVTMTTADGTSATSVERSHPLHEMQAPLTELTVKTPAGLTLNQRRGAAVVKDALDNVVSETDSLFTNGRVSLTTYDYVTRVGTQTSAAGRRRVTVVNTVGLVQRDSAAGVLATAYVYDATGRLTSRTQGNRTWGFGYDALGRMTTVTNPKGEVRRLGYDAADRPTLFVNALGDTARVGYDSIGLVTSVTPAGRPSYLFTYSPTGRLTTYTPPSVGDGAPPLRLQYDADGRHTHLLRSSGDSLVFTYDSTGRTTSVRSGETTTSYTYSPVTGHLTSVTAPTRGTLSFLYDGALVTRHTWSGAIAGNVGFSYDSDLRLSTQTVNGGNSISFGYDADSRLTSAGSLTLVRDPINGRVTGTTLGSVTSSATYDGYSTPSRLTASYSGSPIFDLQTLHDSLGRIVSATEVISGGTTTSNYTYDAAGRLSGVTKNGAFDASYTYDANGNRSSVTTPLGAVSATFDAQDRMLSLGTTTFHYTKDGELRAAITGVDTTRYTYTARGELLSVRLPNGTLIEYLHDPEGRRIAKKVNGALTRGWLYGRGLGPVAELDAAGNLVSRFVYVDRDNVPEYMTRAGVSYRIVTDGRGSVRQVVHTASGAIAQQMSYDALGQVTANTNPGFQPFGFAGGLFDDHTQLVRFGARDYSAAAGRWTAKDPISFAAGDLNLYSYAFGNPINWIDPAGLTAFNFSDLNAGMDLNGILRRMNLNVKGYRAVLREASCLAFELITDEILTGAAREVVYFVSLAQGDDRPGTKYIGRVTREVAARFQAHHRVLKELFAIFVPGPDVSLNDLEATLIDKLAKDLGENKVDDALRRGTKLGNKIRAAGGKVLDLC